MAPLRRALCPLDRGLRDNDRRRRALRHGGIRRLLAELLVRVRLLRGSHAGDDPVHHSSRRLPGVFASRSAVASGCRHVLREGFEAVDARAQEALHGVAELGPEGGLERAGRPTQVLSQTAGVQDSVGDPRAEGHELEDDGGVGVLRSDGRPDGVVGAVSVLELEVRQPADRGVSGQVRPRPRVVEQVWRERGDARQIGDVRSEQPGGGAPLQGQQFDHRQARHGSPDVPSHEAVAVRGALPRARPFHHLFNLSNCVEALLVRMGVQLHLVVHHGRPAHARPQVRVAPGASAAAPCLGRARYEGALVVAEALRLAAVAVDVPGTPRRHRQVLHGLPHRGRPGCLPAGLLRPKQGAAAHAGRLLGTGFVFEDALDPGKRVPAVSDEEVLLRRCTLVDAHRDVPVRGPTGRLFSGGNAPLVKPDGGVAVADVAHAVRRQPLVLRLGLSPVPYVDLRVPVVLVVVAHRVRVVNGRVVEA